VVAGRDGDAAGASGLLPVVRAALRECSAGGGRAGCGAGGSALLHAVLSIPAALLFSGTSGRPGSGAILATESLLPVGIRSLKSQAHGWQSVGFFTPEIKPGPWRPHLLVPGSQSIPCTTESGSGGQEPEHGR
jgi:hypothetical protein